MARVFQQYNIAYYLIATSTEPHDDGWAHTWSNDEAFATYVEKDYQLGQQFKYYARGQVMHERVHGSESETKSHRPPSTVAKLELGHRVNELLGMHSFVGLYLRHIVPNVTIIFAFSARALGKSKASFPKGPDPDQLLIDYAIRAKVVRADEEDCSLKAKNYKKGVRGCNKSDKDQWLADIDSGKFKIVELPADVQRGKRKRRRQQANLDDDDEVLPDADIGPDFTADQSGAVEGGQSSGAVDEGDRSAPADAQGPVASGSNGGGNVAQTGGIAEPAEP